MPKAIQISKFGGPEVLELKEINLPKLGPKEVLLKNSSIGLNFIDTYHRSGLYPLNLPSGIGVEGSGVVIETGSDVKLFKIGDRVAYSSMPIGAYSEMHIMPEEKLVSVPNDISHEIASSMLLKGMTCEYLLHRTYKVTSKDTVLFHAAAGGVGQIFCQWAKKIGCKLIGTVGSDEKIEIAKKNGCDYVINYTTENFAKKTLEITDGKGVDVVYDGVGEKTFEGSIETLKVRGMFVTFGNASGPIKTIELKKHIAPKAIFITRPSVFPYTSTREELEMSAKMVFEAFKDKKINIKIVKKYSLGESRLAHEDLEARKLLGPAVILTEI